MKRGLYKTEAVVLNSFDYGESDRILAFYTEDFGKLKGIAKGARRSRKRFVGNLDPSSHIRLIFFHNERTELVRVEDATLIEGFTGMRVDVERLSEAFYLLELVNEMTREGLSAPAVLGLLLNFLKMLDEGGDSGVLLRFFEIRLLFILGYLPHLTGCVICKDTFGEDNSGGRVFFSSEKGGVVCNRCAPGAAVNLIPVSSGTVRFLTTASRLGTDKLDRLKPGSSFLMESAEILDDFIKHQIGKELKTKRFLAKLRNSPLEPVAGGN